MVQPTSSMICEEGGMWPVKRHTHDKSRSRPETVTNSNPTVPLKVWVLATASCLAVCATLVLATVAIAKWDSITGNNVQYRDSLQYSTGAQENNVETDLKALRQMLKATKHLEMPKETIEPRENLELDFNEAVTTNNIQNEMVSDEINIEPTPAFVGKLRSMIGNIKKSINGVKPEKNIEKQLEESFPTEKYERKLDSSIDTVLNNKLHANLGNKPQFYPEYDSSLLHQNRNIEKKDKPKIIEHVATPDMEIPHFKPTLPDIFLDKMNEKDISIKLPDGYVAGLKKYDENYEYFYQEEDNYYEDYIQSNTMTSYLLEKIQELYDWITGDPDFDSIHKHTTSDKKKHIKFKSGVNSEFGQLLKALNESIVDGNVTIVFLKLRELYYGSDNLNLSHVDSGHTTNRRFILTNGTDLLSFGMLSLDIMLLHNIQLMAWENQESTRVQMLKDPEVFAFNALFMDPNKIESTYQEIKIASQDISKNSISRHSTDFHAQEDNRKPDKNLLEDILDFGLSSARAAIHLGRAYKNAKATLQRHALLATKEFDKSNKQQMAPLGNIARTSDHRYALTHLKNSYTKDENGDAEVLENVTNVLQRNLKQANYTELDCIWYLYCRNLAVTAKLQPPYGTMARINGLALRMISGELPLEKALDSLLMEALTGWNDLQCSTMFPKCNLGASKSVLDSIVQPHRRSHHSKSTKPNI